MSGHQIVRSECAMARVCQRCGRFIGLEAELYATTQEYVQIESWTKDPCDGGKSWMTTPSVSRL